MRLWNILIETNVRLGEKATDLARLSVSQHRGVVPSNSLGINTMQAMSLEKYKVVERGDLVLNRFNAYKGALGRAPMKGIVSPDYFTGRIDSEHADNRYVEYFLRATPIANIIERDMSGMGSGDPNSSAFSRFDVRSLFNLAIPVKNAALQQRIADYLDRETAEIDAAVADLDRYVELMGRRVESTGREIFSELSNKHPLIQTKFLVDITTGSGDTQDAVENGEFPFYVRSDTVQHSGDYEFDCDAVLTSGDGAGVGKIFHLASGKFKAHQRVYVMHSFRRVSPSYFYWMFKSAFPEVIKYGGAKSTVDSVRMPMIANLKLPVPTPTIQEEVSRRLAQLDHEVTALIAESTKLRELLLKRRSVLITEVVTGRKQV